MGFIKGGLPGVIWVTDSGPTIEIYKRRVTQQFYLLQNISILNLTLQAEEQGLQCNPTIVRPKLTFLSLYQCVCSVPIISNVM